jgi:hypothetical protein
MVSNLQLMAVVVVVVDGHGGVTVCVCVCARATLALRISRHNSHVARLLASSLHNRTLDNIVARITDLFVLAHLNLCARLIPDSISRPNSPSTSYAMSTVAQNVSGTHGLRRGAAVIVLSQQMASNVMPWQRLCDLRGLVLTVVPEPPINGTDT